MSRRQDAVQRGRAAVEREQIEGRPKHEQGGGGLLGEFMNARGGLKPAPLSENPRTREYQPERQDPHQDQGYHDSGRTPPRDYSRRPSMATPAWQPQQPSTHYYPD